MDYELDPGQPVPQDVARIAHDVVAGALDDLRRRDEIGVGEAVHDCRKRTKRLRALLRLVRPALGDAYRPANTAFRDAARELSDMRDATALLGTFDHLVAASSGRLPPGGLGAVRSGLALRAGGGPGARPEQVARVDRAVALLDDARVGIDGWAFDADGWDALAGGLRRTYARGRRALGAVHESPTSENVHEWRKRAKDGWHHVQLLTACAPSILQPLARRFHDLADALGDAHDLTVLTTRLRTAPDEFGGSAAVAAVRSLADEQRRDLQQRAVTLGARLYAEPPRRFVARMGQYWETWHDVGPELPAGEVIEIHPPDDGLDGLDLDALRDRARTAGLAWPPSMDRAELISSLRSAAAV
jgi:CHAD domain-containing protein